MFFKAEHEVGSLIFLSLPKLERRLTFLLYCHIYTFGFIVLRLSECLGVRVRSDSWGAVFAGTDDSDVSYADVTITQRAQPNRIRGKSTHLSMWKILQRKGTKPLKNIFYYIFRLKHQPGFTKLQRVDFSPLSSIFTINDIRQCQIR